MTRPAGTIEDGWSDVGNRYRRWAVTAGGVVGMLVSVVFLGVNLYRRWYFAAALDVGLLIGFGFGVWLSAKRNRLQVAAIIFISAVSAFVFLFGTRGVAQAYI